MISGSHGISIWFFVGILLAFYGFIITGEGIYHLVVPPERPVVLAYLHADLWWGALLLALGLFYCYHFKPRRGELGSTEHQSPGKY